MGHDGAHAENRDHQQEHLSDVFHVRFQENGFAWKGVTYDQPDEGVVQAAENPLSPEGLILLYAGLSKDSALQVCDSYLYILPASYVILKGDKQLASGDWELHNDKMIWKFEK